jgi:hypothetical protein
VGEATWLGLTPVVESIPDMRCTCVAAITTIRSRMSPHDHGDVRVHQRLLGCPLDVVSESDTAHIMPVQSGQVTRLADGIDGTTGTA